MRIKVSQWGQFEGRVLDVHHRLGKQVFVMVSPGVFHDFFPDEYEILDQDSEAPEAEPVPDNA